MSSEIIWREQGRPDETTLLPAPRVVLEKLGAQEAPSRGVPSLAAVGMHPKVPGPNPRLQLGHADRRWTTLKEHSTRSRKQARTPDLPAPA